ncbi:MAG: DUF2283 domain-containing protein [Caldilinea sp.]
MRISYEPEVDALYIRLIEGPVECEVIRLNDRVAINSGPEEQIVGVEVLDACILLPGIGTKTVPLENLVTT